VLAFPAYEEEDESPFVALLRVEVATRWSRTA